MLFPCVWHCFTQNAAPMLTWAVRASATAHMTALMVKLGWLNLVRDIVATLSRQERADVVSRVGPP